MPNILLQLQKEKAEITKSSFVYNVKMFLSEKYTRKQDIWVRVFFVLFLFCVWDIFWDKVFFRVNYYFEYCINLMK